MKIQGTGPTKPIDTTTVDGKARPASGSGTSGVARPSEASVGESFDAAKVEALKAAIAAGTFKVNPEAVADKLIANVAELLEPRH